MNTKLLPFKIQEIRKKKDYSQEYIACRLNISQRAYSKMETGETKLHWERINQIADILNVSVWDILDTNKDYNPDEKVNPYTSVDLLKELINKYETKIFELIQENKDLKEKINSINI